MKKKYQTGISLIEIMISLLIGAFLLGGVLQIFIGSKQTYRMQENLTRLQENGRLALELIGRDIRMTGYWGCMTPVTGDVYGEIIGGNSVINLKSAFETTPIGTCGEPVDINAVYYTDNTSTINYSINNFVLRKNTNDLIEGVDKLLIFYGVDIPDPVSLINNGANFYVPANDVVDWKQVVSIRVSLLVRSLEDNISTQPLAYIFNGVKTTPNDRRLRRVFTGTFAIRSRLP
jgi:type IV pilus assembly protein PilW